MPFVKDRVTVFHQQRALHNERELALRVLPPLFMAAALAAVAGGCGNSPSMLDPKGSPATGVAEVWWIMFAVSTAIFVIVVVALYYALHHPRQNPVENLERGPVHHRTMVIGGVWVALSAAILVGMMVLDVHSNAAESAPPSPAVFTIQVLGHDWWWEFTYLNSGVVTANEIHVPVGRPVGVTGTSADVIHSLWLPQLNGKIDLIPGRTNSMWVRADQAGTFRGQCAEYCGDDHGLMAFFVTADPPEQFALWLDNQRKPAAEPTDPLARVGMETFPASVCAGCHTIRGTRANGRKAPDLTHIGSRATIAAGTLPNTRENLIRWISDPQGVKPGNYMPYLGLDPESDFVRSVAAYLESLK